MKTINLDDITRSSTMAALNIIDNELDGFGYFSKGKSGDDLAYKLDTVIRQHIIELFNDKDNAPALMILKK